MQKLTCVTYRGNIYNLYKQAVKEVTIPMSSVNISEVLLTRSVLRLSSTRIIHSVNGVVKIEKIRLTNV